MKPLKRFAASAALIAVVATSTFGADNPILGDWTCNELKTVQQGFGHTESCAPGNKAAIAGFDLHFTRDTYAIILRDAGVQLEHGEIRGGQFRQFQLHIDGYLIKRAPVYWPPGSYIIDVNWVPRATWCNEAGTCSIPDGLYVGSSFVVTKDRNHLFTTFSNEWPAKIYSFVRGHCAVPRIEGDVHAWIAASGCDKRP